MYHNEVKELENNLNKQIYSECMEQYYGEKIFYNTR